MVDSVRVSKNYPDEYRKRVELVGGLRNGRIRASTEKLSERVSENGRISVSTGKW